MRSHCQLTSQADVNIVRRSSSAIVISKLYHCASGGSPRFISTGGNTFSLKLAIHNHGFRPDILLVNGYATCGFVSDEESLCLAVLVKIAKERGRVIDNEITFALVKGFCPVAVAYLSYVPASSATTSGSSPRRRPGGTRQCFSTTEPSIVCVESYAAVHSSSGSRQQDLKVCSQEQSPKFP